MPLKFTNRDLASIVTERVKIFDQVVKGLYASKTPNVCTFSYRYYDSTAKTGRTVLVGTFHPTEFNIDHARAKARLFDTDVKVHKKDIAKTIERAAVIAQNGARTFNDVADEYIKWLQVKPDGKRERKKSFQQDIYALKRPRAAFGTKAIADVTDDDVAVVLNATIEEGHAAFSNNVRSSLSALFKWARGVGRKYTTTNPMATLDKRPPQRHKQRNLSPEEVRHLWWGLDHPDLPCDRRTALAYKLILATSLRPGEVVSALRSEIGKIPQQRGGDGQIAYRIPAERVKMNRVIVQPLNSLAQEIIAELMAMDSPGGTLFPLQSPELTSHQLAKELRSEDRKRRGRVERKVGVMEFLGFTAKAADENTPWSPWTPHDLRRTGSTLLGIAGVSDRDIDRILDHKPVYADTSRVAKTYNVAEHIEQTKRRRPTLDHLDRLLRDIIGKAPATNVVKLRSAA